MSEKRISMLDNAGTVAILVRLKKTRRERLKSALYVRLKIFEIVKRGTLRAFWKSSLLRNIKKTEGPFRVENLWENKSKNENSEKVS